MNTWLTAKSATVIGKAVEVALKVDDATAKKAEEDATSALATPKKNTEDALAEADKKGYTASKNYADTGKTMAALKKEMDDALLNYTPSKALYEAEGKEVTDQKKMLVHAKTWETEAIKTAADLKKAKETATTGWDAVATASGTAYDDAVKATAAAKKAFDEDTVL